ncbi:GPI anchored protein [Penicillium longicatenatum]|nr:GPI anchored protein [Penicillium longicatenatum]
MQLLPTVVLLLLNAVSTCSATEYANSSLEVVESSPASTYSDNDIVRHINEIESRLASTPIHGLKKMSPDEGEKFFFDYWSFGPESQGQLSGREEEQIQSNDTLGIDDLPSNPFHPRSYPFQPSLPFQANRWSLLSSRDFKCPTGTQACGCVFVSVVTVTIHSTVTLSTKTYSSVPQGSPSSSQSTSNTATTENLVPPARPTGISTSTKGTTSRVSVCPTGFYACSAVYHGGCCQIGRNCDTTSCPTTSSTTFTSDGVTIVEPVTTGSGESGSGNTGKCATGWFSCADTVGGGCCPSGYTCGSSCTAAASKTTIAKEQATSRGGKLTIPWGLIGMSLAWWI